MGTGDADSVFVDTNVLVYAVDAADLRRLASDFSIAEDGPPVTEHLATLLHDTVIGGKQVHDANIVATMLAAGIPTLLTANAAGSSASRTWSRSSSCPTPSTHPPRSALAVSFPGRYPRPPFSVTATRHAAARAMLSLHLEPGSDRDCYPDSPRRRRHPDSSSRRALCGVHPIHRRLR